jgi:hypothetical protein
MSRSIALQTSLRRRGAVPGEHGRPAIQEFLVQESAVHVVNVTIAWQACNKSVCKKENRRAKRADVFAMACVS